MQTWFECDLLVVGAGSAGSVLAGRLSEDPQLEVALVEAGDPDYLGLTRIPAAVLKTLGDPKYDWKFLTEPDPTRERRVDQWSRGRVVGGSSAINGLIYVRGMKHDFEHWSELGNSGWSWQEVLPLFRRLESVGSDSTGLEDILRGNKGPQQVAKLSYLHPLTDPFITAAGQCGIPFNPAINGAVQEGLGYPEATIHRGRRLSAFEAYITPNKKRRNLRVVTAALATRLVFEGPRAVGLVVRVNGQEKVIKARKGVVLSAGAFNTPQILMLSGIGPAHALSSHGIAVRADVPAVGQNLQEHAGFRLTMEVDKATANDQSRGLRALWHLTEWVFGNGRGPVGAVSAQAIGFFRSQASLAHPDLQISLFPYGGVPQPNGRIKLPSKSLLSIGINLNYPESRSSLSLRSADPADPVRIHARLLDAPADVDRLLLGLDMARKIAATAPFAEHVLDCSGFPPANAGREADLAFLRSNTRVYMHPISTCRMGSDEQAVVGPDLKVKGFEGLWIADASVFPTHISGNINATVLMIGEKAADLIREVA